MTLSAGLLILALSSLSRNSRYVGLFWLAVWFVSSIVGTVLEGVSREERMHQMYRQSQAMAQNQQKVPAAKTGKGQQQQMLAQREAQQKIWSDFQYAELKAAESDWRPMVSYTANLSRIGKQMLGTDACWERLSKNVPEEERSRFLLENLGPRYPWYWSAALLAVLFGISVCILNFRVKSLDRLR